MASFGKFSPQSHKLLCNEKQHKLDLQNAKVNKVKLTELSKYQQKGILFWNFPVEDFLKSKPVCK